MSKATQHQRIREYIDAHGSITPFEAWDALGITKLSTRINEMIRNGETYKKETVKTVNRFGEPIRFTKYSV